MKQAKDAGISTGRDAGNVMGNEKKALSTESKPASQLPLCQVNGRWQLMSLPSVSLLPLQQRIPRGLEVDAIPNSPPSHKVDGIREMASTMGIGEVKIATTPDQVRHAYDSIFRPPAGIDLFGDELRQ